MAGVENYNGNDVNKKSLIKAIFFSEFHTTAGPKITYQVPENYVSKDVFDAVSVYIIPKTELHKKVITVNIFGHKILGYPVAIDDPKYDRNSLIFNLCFVCDGMARTVQYETVVKKLSGYLVGLEMECHFLSVDETKSLLPEIMERILEDLNRSGTCTIPINDSNTIYLRVVPVTQDPPLVEDHQVPVFIVNHCSFVSSQWDLTTQQILPYIDGFNHVAKIAAETDVEISLVKACIQNMVYYGVVTLIPIFQYTNVYTVTPNIRHLAENKSLQEDCLKYVARNESVLPTFYSIFMLYCGLAPGTTVRDLCTRFSPQALKVDERKLIQFGIMKCFVRRLHKYPIRLTSDAQGNKKHRTISKFFNGLHCYDEICCKTGLQYHELEERVEGDPSVVVCWK